MIIWSRRRCTGSTVNRTPALSASTILWTTTAIPRSCERALVAPVEERPLAEERRPAVDDAVADAVCPFDVQVGLLLTGEARRFGVLGRGRRANGDAAQPEARVRLGDRLAGRLRREHERMRVRVRATDRERPQAGPRRPNVRACSAGTTNPGGTGRPAAAIAARLAPFPPATATSSQAASSNQTSVAAFSLRRSRPHARARPSSPST